MASKLLTFHGDEKIKEEYLASFRADYASDEFINSYELYKIMGIPRVFADLNTAIFENLLHDVAQELSIKFLEAIPVGVDLMPVFYKFMYWLLVDEKDGVINFTKNEYIKSKTRNVADLYLRKINGEEVSKKEWATVYWDVADAHENVYIAIGFADPDAHDTSSVTLHAAAIYAGDSARADAAEAGVYKIPAADAAADAAHAYAAKSGADISADISCGIAHKRQVEKLLQLFKEVGK